MSNSNNAGFGNMIPGFDFLKNLAGQNTNTNSGNPMAAMSQWIAPTLSIEDIDKRIDELKSVQFWLEQNLMGLKATIQALEVQKMTLSTLESMNFSMADMAKAFTPKMPESADSTNPSSNSSTASATKKDADKPTEDVASEDESSETANSDAKSIVDPMAWWNGITAQFGQIANATLKDIQEQSEKAAALAQEQAKALAEAAQTAANTASAPTSSVAASQASESAASTTKKPRARKTANADTAPKAPRKTKTTKS